MNSEQKIIAALLESMLTAINAGDWVVDGSNDPEIAMIAAEALLRRSRAFPACIGS